MGGDEHLREPEVGSDGFLLQVVLGMKELAHRQLLDTTLNSSQRDGTEAWQIAQARIAELTRALTDSELVDSLEDEFILLGLVGPEIRYRSEVFLGLVQAGLEPQERSAQISALHTGISILRTMSQLPELGHCAEAIAGFCEGLIADAALRETVSHASAPINKC
jgi:hypothetical protein